MKLNELLTLLTSTILSFVILEIGLRTFTPYPVNQVSNKVKHEALGYVLSDSMAEIDEHGFRNEALSTIDIVTLGDSHTYGINATSEDSWPKQLGRMLKSDVYNLGMSGYGVLQYQYQLNKAFELQPKTILLGLYLTNDLNDICKIALRNEYWEPRTRRFNFDSSKCPEKITRKASTNRTKGDILWSWLTENIALFSMPSIYYADYTAIEKIKKGEIENAIVVNEGKVKTVIGIERIKEHVKYTDLKIPHIKIASEALKQILTDAKETADLNNIRFGVIFIPSKERVLHDFISHRGYDLPGAYINLVNNEDELKDDISTFLENTDIAYVDILPGMEEALLKEGDIYPSNKNGHPVESGYRVYAEGALDLYQKLGE